MYESGCEPFLARPHGLIWGFGQLPISMARIPLDEIIRLEREVSLERLAAARGITLTRKGTMLTGTCPFHIGDEDAVLTIDTSTNTWTCSTCGTGGVLAWVTKTEGISKRHAVELLRTDYGGGGTTTVVKHSTVKKLPDVIDTAAADSKLMRQVVDYYAAALKKTPSTLAFLAKSGVNNGEALDRFHIGFADRTLGYTIPQANRKEGAEVRGRLQRLGLLKETGHETFRGCITIPLFDENSTVTSVYGRRIDFDPRKGRPDVHTSGGGVWNREAFTASREIVLCSTVFEAMVTWCSGVRYVSAVTDGNVTELLDLIAKSGTTKVTLMFPRTDAGEATVSSIKEKLVGANLEVHRALLPSGMDVQSFVTSAESDGLIGIIRKGEWIGGVRPTSATNPALPGIDPVKVAPPATVPGQVALPTTDLPSASTSASGEIVIEQGDRRWRVRGLSANTSYERLRVHVYVSRDTRDARTAGFFVDVIELYSARQRNAFVEQAAEELGTSADIIKRDLGHVLLRLEAIQDEQIQATLEPKSVMPTMSEPEREAALALLRDPGLLDRIVHDFDRTGVVGENSNRLVGYLCAISRKLPDPLAMLIQSSSAAGKSNLLDAVLAFVPEEDRVEYSAMTGQALYYVEPGQLRHRVLAIAEEAGAERASYALKLLQSQGTLTIASTAKEAGTGRMTTHEYRVEGPVALMMTTTATEIDDELANRCLVLSIDEGRDQTRAIHRRQRDAETLEGMLARQQRDSILHLHRNAQRLLRTIPVVNPYAPELTFIDGSTRTRRDHRKYLTLIRVIALLHQHQRDVKRVEHEGSTVEYIEATREDIAVADKLMADVGHHGDELPPHTRHVLGLLDGMVSTACTERGIEKGEYRFSRREAREQLGIGGTQLWTHLRRLVDGEYLYVHPSKRGRGIVYELALPHAATAGSVRGNGLDVRGSFGARSGQIRGPETSILPEETGGVRAPRSGSTNTRHSAERGAAPLTSTSERGR